MNNSMALMKVDRQQIEQMDKDILALLPGAQKMPPGIRHSLAQASLIYGLDPFMKEIMACEFKGQWTLYVGVAGMRTAARHSNQGRYIGRVLVPLNNKVAETFFYGMSAQEVRDANGIKDVDVAWLCAVFKEGSPQPFVELGICGPSMPQAYKDSRIPDWKMAKARAERTALAAAFALPFSLNERLDALLAEEVEGGAPGETVEGEIVKPPPPQAKDACMVNGKHWMAHDNVRSRFWARMGELGLSNEEAHQALGVESIYDFRGTMQEALDVIIAWIDARTQEREQAEIGGDEQMASEADRAAGLPAGPPGVWQHGKDDPPEQEEMPW